MGKMGAVDYGITDNKVLSQCYIVIDVYTGSLSVDGENVMHAFYTTEITGALQPNVTFDFCNALAINHVNLVKTRQNYWMGHLRSIRHDPTKKC